MKSWGELLKLLLLPLTEGQQQVSVSVLVFQAQRGGREESSEREDWQWQSQ